MNPFRRVFEVTNSKITKQVWARNF